MRQTALRALPPVVLALVFAAVVSARSRAQGSRRRELPNEPLRGEVCTWYCHNHGCPHRAVLPGWLTSDRGAFGLTIRGLSVLGSALSRDRGTGYGLANLLVFCVAWPVGTYGLWLVVLRQHEAIARLKRREARR